MNPTIYRDQVAKLAKTDPDKGVEISKKIVDPWFQAQAWAHLTRWADSPLRFSRHAAKSATKTKDDYQKSAVRAWEVAALAERGYQDQARKSLTEAVELAASVSPLPSRAEALFLLFQSAFKISNDDAKKVEQVMISSCTQPHWRVKRALREAALMLKHEVPPREFFW